MKKIFLLIFTLCSIVNGFSQTRNDYLKSGREKTEIKDYHGAIADYTKAIELNPKYEVAYFSRGLAKLKLDQKDSGCLDLSKAGELGYEDSYKAIKAFCN